MIQLKSERELEKMREAGRHVAEILLLLREMALPGVTTGELNEAAAHELGARKLESSFLGYSPGGAPAYPAVLCTSVNEEIVHGIPGDRVLVEGDLLKLDFGVIFSGFHGDSAVAFPIGEAPEPVLGLQEATLRSLYAGVEQMVPGNRLGDVSNAVQTAVEGAGFTIVRDFVGHGIGRSMHEPPQVPNFGRGGRGPRLRPGMVLAIEPMVNMGTAEVEVLDDGWTAVTADGECSCHFEHTVAITQKGPQILTQVAGSH
ncbi:MAG: type I methionyl aminopeptidase [Deltaproteobacteria bacterium]|nr:type I methionyl aminopeptidase [Deltaproteobacteria bacterium]MBW2415161.1 type I methionyl aminopeptidase [Deltaproteobacteria bacterium]